ncbi:hypothetical protein BHE74_00010182, partial [Ensete ventricosum]
DKASYRLVCIGSVVDRFGARIGRYQAVLPKGDRRWSIEEKSKREEEVEEEKKKEEEAKEKRNLELSSPARGPRRRHPQVAHEPSPPSLPAGDFSPRVGRKDRGDIVLSDAHLILLFQSVFITLSGAWKLGGFGFAISLDQATGGSTQPFHYSVCNIGRYVLVRQLTGTWTIRYWVVPSNGVVSVPLTVNFGCRQPSSDGISRGREKKKREKKKLESADPSPVGDFFSPRGEIERGNVMYLSVPVYHTIPS